MSIRDVLLPGHTETIPVITGGFYRLTEEAVRRVVYLPSKFSQNDVAHLLCQSDKALKMLVALFAARFPKAYWYPANVILVSANDGLEITAIYRLRNGGPDDILRIDHLLMLRELCIASAR
jgi:hypothetical protein